MEKRLKNLEKKIFRGDKKALMEYLRLQRKLSNKEVYKAAFVAK